MFLARELMCKGTVATRQTFLPDQKYSVKVLFMIIILFQILDILNSQFTHWFNFQKQMQAYI